MSLSIGMLLAPVTSAQVRAKFVSMLNVLGIPADQWRAGGVASSLLTVASMTYASFSQLIADAVASGFLGTASGDWLTLLAQYVYNVIRSPATFASGTVTFTNIGGGVYSFNPGEVTVQNVTTSKTYTNVNVLSIGAGSLGSPTVVNATFQAVVSGSSSNANPGDVSKLVTVMLGVTCTNSAALVGLDAQSDGSLVSECQSKLGSLSVGGPSQAYQYAVDQATNVTTGLPVNVNRRNVQTDPTTGTVKVTVASPSGPVVADDLTGIVNSIVALAVPDAVTFLVQSATAVSYSPTVTVWAQGLAGVDQTSILNAALTAVTNYIQNYPIGGLSKGGTSALWGSGVAGAIEEVSTAIFAVDGCTDLLLGPAQVAADSIAAANITVNIVPAP